jgi:lipopolysaccharide biosynthesis glycosyltransferase
MYIDSGDASCAQCHAYSAKGLKWDCFLACHGFGKHFSCRKIEAGHNLIEREVEVKDPISIGICFDHNVLTAVTILIESIRRNRTHDRHINIYLITTYLGDNLNTTLQRDVDDKFKVTIITVNDKFYTFPHRDYITRGTYLRLMLPELLQDVRKVLYLDVDTVVECDLSSLFDTAVGDRPLAAVPDYAMIVGSPHWKNFRIPYKGGQFTFKDYVEKVLNLSQREDDYFNCGVLLINLDYWRAHNIVERIIEYLIANPELYLMDQDALSHCVGGNFIRLDPRWNSFSNCSYPADAMVWLRSPQRRRWEAIRAVWRSTPRIIHYAGKDKPWVSTDDPTPHDDRWWHYAKESPAWDSLRTIFLEKEAKFNRHYAARLQVRELWRPLFSILLRRRRG